MYFTKVISHHVLFLIFWIGLYFYFDLNILFTIAISLHAYIGSYLVSLWTIKFIFLFAKVKTENKCVLITGCDTGFGHQSALLLNKIGFKVFACCMEPKGEGASNIIKKAQYPTKMIVIKMDVTNDKDIEYAYDTVKSCMSDSENLFGIVNNAGITVMSEFDWGHDLTDCTRVLDVNLIGIIKVTRQFLPLIRQAKGRIINIESLAGLIPIPHAIFYGISKAGAVGFSDNLRIGLYRFGVPVESINPWIYNTPIADEKMILSQYDRSFTNSSEEIRKAYGVEFMQKAKKGISATKSVANISNDVPNTVVSALTVYEPDPRYIVAPLLFQPFVRMLLWMSKETLLAHYQISAWIFGLHKIYPDN